MQLICNSYFLCLHQNLEIKLKKMKTINTNTIKKQTLELNDKAIKTTENVILTSFEKIERAQHKTDELLKKGFEFSEKQQDKFFNSLENSKKMIWTNLNKRLDFFSKN